MIIICVGTPSNPDGSADLSHLLDAVKEVFAASDPTFKVIVTKSTVPPSTLSTRVKPYVEELSRTQQKPMGLASNPEFLREGHAWDDFMNPDRTVIGVEDEASQALLDTIYRPFNAPIHYVSYSSAEFIKYLSNTLLSTPDQLLERDGDDRHSVGDIDVPEAFENIPRGQALVRKPRSDDNLRVPGLRLRRVLPAQGHCSDAWRLTFILRRNWRPRWRRVTWSFSTISRSTRVKGRHNV